MAKRTGQFVNPVNAGFQSPYLGYEEVLGQGRSDNAQSIADSYAQAYQDTAGFGVKHPILTGLGGLLLGGPAAAIGLPLAAKKNQKARQQAVLEGYNDWYQNQVENIAKFQPLDTNMTTRGAVQNQGFDPSFIKGAVSDDFAKTLLEGGAAKYGLEGARDQLFGGYDQAFDAVQRKLGPKMPVMGGGTGISNTQTGGNPVPMPNQQLPPLSAGPMLDPNMYGDVQQPQQAPQSQMSFQAGAQGQQQVPLRPYRYESPELAKQTISSLGSIINNVNENAAEQARLPAQIAKLLAEGKVEEAKALLTQAQTTTERQRPGLIQAQTKFENERYRGGPAPRSPNVIDLMTPEQRQAYAGRISAGQAPGGGTATINALSSLQKTIFNPDIPDEQKAAAVQLYNQLAPQAGQTALQGTRDPGGWFGIGAKTTYGPATPQGQIQAPSKNPTRLNRPIKLPSGRSFNP